MGGYRKGHGYAALRKGRVSVAGATYFLTLCIERRTPCLARQISRDAVLAELKNMEADGSWHVCCAMTMPDHLHLLVVFGDRLRISRAVARLKAKTRAAIRNCGASWQSNYFDHRLDPDEGLLPLFCYMFKNPYRAGIAEAGDQWPGWYCCPEDSDWFSEYLEEDLPPPQWLKL